MSSLLTLLCCVMTPISLDEARELTRQRHAALDRFQVEIASLYYIAQDAETRHDPQTWIPHEGLSYRHEVTIVRPGFLHDWLTDRPGIQHDPVRTFMSEERMVRQWLNPLFTGEIKYYVDETDAHCHSAPYSFIPFLWILDLQIPDAVMPRLDTLTLLEQPSARIVGVFDGLTRFQVELANPGGHAFTLVYEVDLNSLGTPMHARTVLHYATPGLQPTVWEMRTLSVTNVGGFELPMTAIVTVQNPNITVGAGIHRFEVAWYEQQPELTPQDIAIVPVARNAMITTREKLPRDQTVNRHYDADGVLVAQVEYFGFADPIASPRTASTGVRATEGGVALAIGGVGLLLVACLRLMSRRAL